MILIKEYAAAKTNQLTVDLNLKTAPTNSLQF
jgi:hypothetical protein